MLRAQCLLLALFAVLVPLVTAVRGPSSAEEISIGAFGWRPIKNISDPHVQEMAKWAVSEYNLKNHKGLVFQRVVQGEEQVVGGLNYRLLISVKDGSSIVNYEASVYERVWNKIRQLVSFIKK